ncbi:hypothetical protein [Lacrimispora sp.]|uniref:hypothetical protein n=1 Tax=Lacrimispora sp. TaxID=2719234 RepID=UPI0028A80E74|nr:hypothetical protein [Lacrimispora sp.]
MAVFEKLYAAYDYGKLLGEHTSREWEIALSIKRQTIRDYAREGRTYGGRYTFRTTGEGVLKETEDSQEEPEITAQDLEKFKRSLKIGARFVYESFRKDFVRGSRYSTEKVIVMRKYPHIVELISLKDRKRIVTMSYTELLRQRKDRMKKKKLASGR